MSQSDRRDHMAKDCRQREANSAKKDAVSFMAKADAFKLDSGCSGHLVGEKTTFVVLER